jgi:hypothetical protein
LVLEVKFMYFSSYATLNEVTFHHPAVASCTSALPNLVGHYKHIPCNFTTYINTVGLIISIVIAISQSAANQHTELLGFLALI